MNTLRLVGLAILAGLTLSIFFVMYSQVMRMSESKKTKKLIDKLNSNIEHALISGSPERVRVDVPSGYKLRFEENQIALDGMRLPENGYPRAIEGPTLPPGKHSLEIVLRKGKIILEVTG